MFGRWEGCGQHIFCPGDLVVGLRGLVTRRGGRATIDCTGNNNDSSSSNNNEQPQPQIEHLMLNNRGLFQRHLKANSRPKMGVKRVFWNPCAEGLLSGTSWRRRLEVGRFFV